MAKRRRDGFAWMNQKQVFSGGASVDMWNEINSAKTIFDLRWALYTVCCRIQELETIVQKLRWQAERERKAGERKAKGKRKGKR